MKQLLLLMCSVALMFATGCKNDETNPTPPPATTGSDLSAAGCANSYLVHGAGAYSFDATVMGNGVSTEPFAATKLSPSSAALLWQDAPRCSPTSASRRAASTSRPVKGRATPSSPSATPTAGYSGASTSG